MDNTKFQSKFQCERNQIFGLYYVQLQSGQKQQASQPISLPKFDYHFRLAELRENNIQTSMQKQNTSGSGRPTIKIPSFQFSVLC